MNCLGRIASSFLLILALTIGCESPPRTLFATHVSPDESHQLLVYAGEAFGFGSQEICLFSRNVARDEEQELLCTRLHNDGANLRASNVQVAWVDGDTVEVVLSGEEQSPVTSRFAYRF
ncbi:MAG: hypothetical protein AB8H86_22600 [Polyangiales bacterium]